MKYPPHLSSLIDYFKKLPGVGHRSAERFAFQVINWPPQQLEAFAGLLSQTSKEVHYCSSCGAFSEEKRCFFCDDTTRHTDQICIVANPKDIFSIEQTHSYSGLYHVLGGVLSPSNGLKSDKLRLSSLKERLQQGQITEMILAFDSTVEGDATTLFLKKELSKFNITISRLAFGIPVGSSLDYIDGSTLSRALTGRGGF